MPEDFFLSGCNNKIWKRSTTKAIVYNYKERTDKIDLIKNGKEFADKYEERNNVFGNSYTQLSKDIMLIPYKT